MSPLPLALPGVRLHCTGWTLTGHTPAAGPLNLVQFTITNDATLAWHWAPAFRLAADAGPNGTAAPAEGWYLAGASATVTAYPSAYYHFDAWSGDTAGASAQEGPVFTAVMDAPRAVAASFAPNLTAAHGVPEYWLAQYGWTGDFEAAAAADTDGDGMPAWAEWRADTDPTDPLSRLALTALAPEPPGGWRLVWTGGRNRTQEVQRADSPAGPWRPVHTNLPPTAATNAVTLPGGAASGFFRIAVP
ncbi:MAG: hypothetical protein LBW77_05145 [Verrucomicrobiota bacterium]|nr:hypothetical protein [Verrucomicrobiota bacterium]